MDCFITNLIWQVGKKHQCGPCSKKALHPCIEYSFKMTGNGNMIYHTSELFQ